jgi:hypothetical protein
VKTLRNKIKLVSKPQISKQNPTTHKDIASNGAGTVALKTA